MPTAGLILIKAGNHSCPHQAGDCSTGLPKATGGSESPTRSCQVERAGTATTGKTNEQEEGQGSGRNEL